MNATGDKLDSYAALIKMLLEQISRLPPSLRQEVEREVKELLHLIEDIRSPRFMLIGRRGAGKSSLINALFGVKVAEVGAVEAQTGEPRWHEYERDGKKVEILDTRGIQEGKKPLEEDAASTPEKSILTAIREKCPDVALFLCKAKEVDSAIDESLDTFEEILGQLKKAHDYSPPIVGILTQCDELDPADVRKLPTDDEEKNQNINTAVKVLERHLKSRNTLNQNFVEIVPTVAFVRYRPDGTRDENRDYRWNIDRLAELLVKELPDGPKVAFARLARVRKVQRKIANKIVNICAAACSAIGATPIPVADLPVITSIQVAMVVVIGYISGRELSLKAATEFLAALGINVGTGFVLREVARGLVKLLPGLGDIVAASIAFTATQALGRAATAYFIDETPMDTVKQQLGKS